MEVIVDEEVPGPSGEETRGRRDWMGLIVKRKAYRSQEGVHE